MAEIKQKLMCPSVPNFIFLEAKVGLRQDGFKESPKISLGDIPDESLEELAAEWKDQLFRNAYRLRKVREQM